MFPEPKQISGRKLVPQLAVGCVVFSFLGLVGTFFLANLMQSCLAKHQPAKPPTELSGRGPK